MFQTGSLCIAPIIAILGTVAAAVVNQGAALTYGFTQATRYEPKAWTEGRDRFPSGAVLKVAIGGERRPVAPGFYASADAAISFDGKRVLFSGRRVASEPWQIWEVPLAGGTPRRVTQNDSNCIRPLYLPNTGIVYTRWTPGESYIELVDGAKASRLTYAPGRYLTDDVLGDGRILFESARDNVREIFAMYPDGTGMESLRCDHGPDRGDARQISSGDVVFGVGGRLARFTSALAAQADLPQPDRESVGPVAEISPGEWIVALRGRDGRLGLYRWTSAGKRAAVLEAPANADAVEPVVVAARVAPRRFPSALLPTRRAGILLCLDARASRSATMGREVTRARLYTQNGNGSPLLLGQTTIERDGSFYVEVPGDKPLRIELADASGRVLQGERHWFWMRTGEQRICVGCHAGPEHAPENKVPEVLLRSTIPSRMLGEAP
jgi:hypothetical protein